MTVIRRKRADQFAIIPNSASNDERLSFEALGVLVYLLAKPNDWCVSLGDLRRRGGIGRDKAYRILNELMEVGYILRRERSRCLKSGKQLNTYDYLVSDVAEFEDKPRAENQDAVTKARAEKADTDFPHAYKERTTTKTDYSSSARDAEVRAALEQVVDVEIANALIDHFDGMEKALTHHTAKLKAKQLEQCTNPNEAAREMIAKGWVNIDEQWLGQLSNAGKKTKGAAVDHPENNDKDTGHTSIIVAANPKFAAACLGEWGQSDGKNHSHKLQWRSVNVPDEIVVRTRESLARNQTGGGHELSTLAGDRRGEKRA